jgi:hypothetical protein
MVTNFQISARDLELLRQSTAFDPDWYASYYQDVEMGGFDPAEHYLWLGWRLNRRPSENAEIVVDVQNYLLVNPNVANCGIHPVAHYFAFGLGEGPHLGESTLSGLDGDVHPSRDSLELEGPSMNEHQIETQIANLNRFSTIVEDQIDNVGQLAAFSDLIGALIADRASQNANPLEALERFVERERSAAYHVVAQDDDNSPIKGQIRLIQMHTKEDIFHLARNIILSSS